MKNFKFKNLLLGLISLSALGIASCGETKTSPSVETPTEEPSSEAKESASESKEASKEESKEPSSEIKESASDSTSEIDYGTLEIIDCEVAFQDEYIINPSFSKEEYEEDLEYEFEGNNISIIDGKIKGLVPGTTTKVTAKSEHFEKSFEVKVNYISATLGNETGAENKFTINVPTSDTMANYILHATVDVTKYRQSGYTRLASFAFNGSDNSWYNIEKSTNGDINLFGHFNGVEKYWIYLGKDTDFIKDNAIHFDIKLVKKGQATLFYINDSLKCGFTEEELVGYADLSSMEVTASADRDDAGEYEVKLTNIYYEDESSEAFKKYGEIKAFEYDDFTLANEDGSEAKYSYGIPTLVYSNYVYSTTVDMPLYDSQLMRPSAFAFNGSDNSWYNIEMDSNGNLILYGHFNGVEKYNIYLANKNDLLVNDVIHYTVNILKEGQATYFFFNDQLKCSFTDEELEGYGKLNSFEVTSCSDVWHDGASYQVNFTNNKIEGDDSATYAKYYGLIYQDYGTKVLESSDGNEAKVNFGGVPTNMLFTTKVVCDNIDPDGWTRLFAGAFNGSDNSWYNIELDNGGNINLFAHFNGVEKYWIYLGNKADYLVNEKITFNVALLKEGQETYFFINDKLYCSFTSDEMNGYSILSNFEVTAASNRGDGGAFTINLENATTKEASSEAYKSYKAKIFNDYGTVTLHDDNGNEAKANFNFMATNAIFTTHVSCDDIDSDGWTRLFAGAFNGSDNSWYNIELSADNNINLFGHFNGNEKYWINIGTRESLTVEGKIQFDVAILKQGQATYLFINDKLVCDFTEADMSGYSLLTSFEVTAASNRGDGGAFTINLENAKVEDDASVNYLKYANMFTKTYDDATLEDANGNEAKIQYGSISTNMVYQATIEVASFPSGAWLRPIALAFNGSDNSWYNIEMSTDGSMNLFARFNGVEKYWISLGSKNDYMVDETFKFTVTILKQGQATTFFINGVQKANFTLDDLNGYSNLGTFEITACANRDNAGAYVINVKDAKIDGENSDLYQEFVNLKA